MIMTIILEKKDKFGDTHTYKNCVDISDRDIEQAHEPLQLIRTEGYALVEKLIYDVYSP